MLDWLSSRFRVKRPTKRYENFYDEMFKQFEKEDGFSLEFMRSNRVLTIPPEQLATRARMRQYQIDLRWMRHLYDKVIIPQVEEFGFVKFKTAERSDFVQRIDLDHERYSDSHDILRLGYVHLYHKFEAYRSDMIDLIDKSFYVTKAHGILKTMQDYYGLDVSRGPLGVPKLREVAFIANSTKHKDGKPRKDGSIPPRFVGLEDDQRIRLFEFELLEDIAAMDDVGINFFHVLATVHHRRRLTMDKANAKYRTFSPEEKELFDLNLKVRTGQATYLVQDYFTEVPEAVKRKWPDITGVYPLPEEETIRWSELSEKFGWFH